MELPLVAFPMAGAMAHLDHHGYTEAVLSAQLPTLHRSSPEPTPRGATECCQAPHYSQGSPKEEMALQLLDLKTGLAPPGLFSDYRQAMVLEWVPLSCSQNARQGGKGHSMHYFWS